ncbi:MAG: S8 family serine peptidase, partial [Acutalibacteraceae bacterium]
MANGIIEIFQDIFENPELVEIIVKYSGDINAVAQQIGAEVEELLGGYAIVTIRPQDINRLYLYPEVESIELPKKLFIKSTFNLISTCVRSVHGTNFSGLTGKGAIVAIIDYGIDYTHMDFRNPDGSTRILYLWDQSLQGMPPAGFASGAEYTSEQINLALNSPDPYEIVPSRDINGHGSAVAGIAAGNGRESNGANTGVAPEADLIIVKVGTRGFASFTRTTEIMRAVKYIIDKARQLNRPVAINMSFGTNQGSHRGDSLFETYLSEASTEWKNVIVVPTGNEGDAGHHYSGRLISNSVHELNFFTAVGLEEFYITLWKNFTDEVSVEVIFPNGKSSGVIGIENQVVDVQEGNTVLTII